LVMGRQTKRGTGGVSQKQQIKDRSKGSGSEVWLLGLGGAFREAG